ncbi:hypothetical protein VCB98_13190 [Gammaproteobacteria bacterium AB-CW1]|uniref:Uncharacterized protein n=1 Tax=Natronospira elongata TaxID=3110268 RepID=A0AAP6MM51_9GAMM|nr:hypothetical protein [Gammaproteobacteria bacterium AB-CW1]
MSRATQLTFISWDTSDNERRIAFDRLVEPFCIHYQGSVRLCHLSAEDRRLLTLALSRIATREDRLIITVVRKAPEEAAIQGLAGPPQPHQAILI